MNTLRGGPGKRDTKGETKKCEPGKSFRKYQGPQLKTGGGKQVSHFKGGIRAKEQATNGREVK